MLISMSERLSQPANTGTQLAVLKVQDVVELTGMSRWQVVKYVRNGALPTLPRATGEHHLIPIAALHAFIGAT